MMKHSLKYMLHALLVSAVMAVAPAPASAEKRVALVIGNDDYRSLPVLNNARKDARGIASKLEALGFEVVQRLNAGERDLWRALDEFEQKLHGADVGVVFYAGHGIASAGKNWLIPADARVEVEADLRSEGIDSGELLKVMERAGTPLNIVILDACRDNPLPGRSRSVARGLVVEQTAAISGTAIVYSAGQGEAAEDGDPGEHGVFTGELLKVLDTPGLSFEQVFRRTAAQVKRRTRGEQNPWFHSSITDEFYFSLSPKAASPKVASLTDSPPGSDRDTEFWTAIKKSKDAADFEAYLQQFPDGTYAYLVKKQLRTLRGQQTASLTPPTAAIEPLDETYVIARTANLRSAPDVKSRKLTTLPADTGVQATGKTRDGKWIRIAHSGADAFIWGALVQPVDASELSAWDKVKDSRSGPELKGFLSDYPSGHFAPRARRLMAVFLPPAQLDNFRPGRVFRDCADCPEMVVIPAGHFMMGSTEEQQDWAIKQGMKPERVKGETLRHRVDIGYTFAVGKYEVTKGQFAKFIAETGYKTDEECHIYDKDNKKYEYKEGMTWQNPGYSQANDHPVVCVNWWAAKKYVEWLSLKTGQTYRLLSESEWEYAARAGTDTMHYWGDDWDNREACRYENVRDETSGWTPRFECSDGSEFTTAVGKYQANAFGLHDMLGNVHEWVEDCWNDDYDGAPTDGSANTSGECDRRMFRSGSWITDPGYLRSAHRGWAGSDARASYLGFRIARDL